MRLLRQISCRIQRYLQLSLSRIFGTTGTRKGWKFCPYITKYGTPNSSDWLHSSWFFETSYVLFDQLATRASYKVEASLRRFKDSKRVSLRQSKIWWSTRHQKDVQNKKLSVLVVVPLFRVIFKRLCVINLSFTPDWFHVSTFKIYIELCLVDWILQVCAIVVLLFCSLPERESEKKWHENTDRGRKNSSLPTTFWFRQPRHQIPPCWPWGQFSSNRPKWLQRHCAKHHGHHP